MNIKKKIRKLINLQYILKFYNVLISIRYYFKGFKSSKTLNFIRIRKDKDELRIKLSHAIYFNDVLDNFYFYFTSVYPKKINGYNVVDYSKPDYQKVKGFDKFSILFSSFAEPVSTIRQYLNFANLKAGDVAIDIGAYSGLSSIIFKEKVSKAGQVIAIEADPLNFESLIINTNNFKKIKNSQIHCIKAAFWSHNKGISFSSEGHMGSSASDFIGSDRGEKVFIPTVTLKEIINLYNLKKISFIKCDIEGGELEFINDSLLQKYLPRLVIECHIVNNSSTEHECTRKLLSYGYNVKKVTQVGYPLPLLFCEKN